MSVATVTSKGQITIPKKIREHLDVRSGDRVEFRIGEDGSVSVVPITRRARDVFGAFAHKASRPVGVAETKRKVAEALRRRSGAAESGGSGAPRR